MTRSGERHNNFDLARLVAALCVLVSHSFSISGHSGGEPLYAFTDHTLSLGTLAVFVFFIMSGYLITQSWSADPHAARFLLRRLLRILPALYAFLLISTVIIGPICTSLSLREYFSRANVVTYLGQIGVFGIQGGLPGVFEHNPLPLAFNGSLWSIRVEVACYILALICGMCGILRFRLGVTLIAVLLMGAYVYSRYYVEREYWLLNMELHQSLDVVVYFFVGSALFLWGARVRYSPVLSVVIGALVFAVLRGDWLRLALLAVLPYAVLSLALAPTRVTAGIGRYGDYSYGIYIWAFPVQQMVMYCLHGRISLPLFILMSTFLTLMCAFASWYLIERPALRLKPRRLPAERQGQAEAVPEGAAV